MRNPLRAFAVGIGIAIFALALLLMTREPAGAQPGRAFSNHDLRGSYAFAGVHCCVVGRFTADGAGSITGTHTLAGGNDVHHESLTCIYQVFANGTGAMTCDTLKLDGPGAGDTAIGGTTDFVLADGGRELFSINTDEGGEVEGLISIAKRQ